MIIYGFIIYIVNLKEGTLMDKCENLFSQVAREHGFDIEILHQSVAGNFIHSPTSMHF